MSDKWISMERYMPPMDGYYCPVVSAYSSKLVMVKTKEGKEYRAELVLYGNPVRGWDSEWWEDGMLSKDNVEGVVCWRPIDYFDDGTYQTFDEILVANKKYEKYQKQRKARLSDG